MSDPAAAAPHEALCSRSKEVHAARLEKYEREKAIIDSLNHGLSVPEIAALTNVSEKRCGRSCGRFSPTACPPRPPSSKRRKCTGDVLASVAKRSHKKPVFDNFQKRGVTTTDTRGKRRTPAPSLCGSRPRRGTHILLIKRIACRRPQIVLTDGATFMSLFGGPPQQFQHAKKPEAQSRLPMRHLFQTGPWNERGKASFASCDGRSGRLGRGKVPCNGLRFARLSAKWRRHVYRR